MTRAQFYGLPLGVAVLLLAAVLCWAYSFNAFAWTWARALELARAIASSSVSNGSPTHPWTRRQTVVAARCTEERQ